MDNPARRSRGSHWLRRKKGRFPLWARGHPVTLARWVLAALLLIAAAVFAARPAIAGGEPTAATVVAAHDLALGSTLRGADVTVVQMPVELRPDGALADPAEANGHTLVGIARKGEPITDTRVLGSHSRPQGTVTVPVRLADAGVSRLLRPGERVDVVTLGPAEQGKQTVARAVTVLTVLERAAAEPGGPAPDGEGPLVLLAVPDDASARVAAVSLAQPVTITLR